MDLSTQFRNEMLKGFMQQHPEPPSLNLLGLLQDATVQKHMKGPRVRQKQMARVKIPMKTVMKDDKKQKAPDFTARGRPKKQQE